MLEKLVANIIYIYEVFAGEWVEESLQEREKMVENVSLFEMKEQAF